MKKSLLGLILIALFSFNAIAQSNKEYKILSKFRKFSIVGGPVLYNKAKIYPQYGDYTFENKPIWGFNAGVEYDFYPDRKWSLITGLILAYEPAYNINYCIKKGDLYPAYTEDAVGEANMYANPSFSVPLLGRFNIKANENLFIYITTGFKVKYFPPGEASLTLIFRNGDQTEAKEVFGLKLQSPDNSFQGSYVIGSGFALAMNSILVKTTLLYVMNFQNTMDGEYQFGNLTVSPSAGGDYELSGNYLGLLFSFTIARKKYKDH